MKQPKTKPSRSPSIAERFIEHLQRDIDFYRTEYLFLKGKVERLELATFAQGNPVAREYTQRTDKQEIIDVPVEQPTKKTWKQVQDEWASMTDEQKEAAIAKGAN